MSRRCEIRIANPHARPRRRPRVGSARNVGVMLIFPADKFIYRRDGTNERNVGANVRARERERLIIAGNNYVGRRD